jgi:hypothetical protein
VLSWALAAQAVGQALPSEPLLHNISPLGFVSAINTPVAGVLPMGSVALGLVNTNPEIAKPRVGAFGSLTTGLGLLPGLEAFGRLSFAGDLQCNLYGANCPGIRDLSVSAKYQLPWVLPLNTRVAAGMTDFGGAATNYRSKYLVATSDLGPVDVSLGFAQKDSAQALMGGTFGSVVLRISDPWAVQYENDTQGHRLGTSYVHPLGPTTQLVVSLSHQKPVQSGRPSTQLGLQLVRHLGQQQAHALQSTTNQGPAPRSSAPWAAAPTAPSATSASAAPNAPTAPTAPTAPSAPNATNATNATNVHSAPTAAPSLAQQLQQTGFTQVQVTTHPSKLLHVQAEPTAWRQSRLQAMGVALQTVLAQSPKNSQSPETTNNTATSTDPWLITLTFQGQPVLSALTSAPCAAQFKAGYDTCGAQTSVQFFSHPAIPEHLAQLVQVSPSAPTRRLPQFELGLGLRNAVGTEYGLADYSAAAELTAELPLAKGLALQAAASTPISHSADFGPNRVFSDRRHRHTQFEQALISYWRPMGALGLQATAGYINHTDRGGQLDAIWHSPDGRWRASGLLGHYTRTEGVYVTEFAPTLGSLRYSVIPAQWQVEVTAGQFYNQDRGWHIASNHWMGDTRFKLYYRRTGVQDDPRQPVRAFAGIEASFPLGPKASMAQVGITPFLRGADRWSANLETKVGERDNLLTAGYGQVPKVRHGLTTDVTDHDRSGLADLWADRDRMRLAMRGR